MRLASVLLALAVATAASAQVYKWTDEKGRTIYGDKPPDEAKTEKLEIKVQSYDGPPQVMDWSQIIRAKSKYGAGQEPAAPKGITMYSTTWCAFCKRARIYFEAKSIAYKDIDVEASPEGKKAFAALGGGGVPLILVDGKAMRGFSVERMDQMLAKR
jgi:glutaredoxin